MRHSYLVLGTGMGRAIVHCLAGQKDTESIIIGDINHSKAARIAGEINRKFPIECESVKFDAVEPKKYLKKTEKPDVIISALPAQYNLSLAGAAIDAGIHFCDLGGVLSVLWKMKSDLDSEAVCRQVSVVPDCGLMPGLGVMVARKLVLESIQDSPESLYRDVVIYVGGLPQKLYPPLNYQRMFYLGGLKHLCYDRAAILINGDVVFVPPLTGYELFKVDNLARFSPDKSGLVEAFITAGASLAPWNFKELGVTSLCEKTIRWPGFVEFVSAVEERDFEEKIGPMINIPVDEKHPDLAWMKVVIGYEKNEKQKMRSSSLFSTYDAENGLTAMEQTTGFPAALIAQAIARGETMPGVFTPDQALSENALRKIIIEVGKYFQIKEETTP